MFDNEITNIKRSIYQKIYPFLANNKTKTAESQVLSQVQQPPLTPAVWNSNRGGFFGPQSARMPGLRVSATPAKVSNHHRSFRMRFFLQHPTPYTRLDGWDIPHTLGIF